MDQQPEQQPVQPQSAPVAELPPVPVVAETVQPVAVQEAPAEPTPAESVPAASTPSPQQVMPMEEVAQPEQVPLASEPMGRPQPQVMAGGLEWQASEYVEHEKSIKWFIVLAVIAVALAALAVFLLKNYTFAVLIVVMAVAVVVWARRPAMNMSYQLDGSGVSINGKHFAMHDFRAFGVLQDGAIYAVTLLPNKRFSPGVTIYFPHELGEQIVDILGSALPMETIQPDWIDQLTRRLNF